MLKNNVYDFVWFVRLAFRESSVSWFETLIGIPDAYLRYRKEVKENEL